MPRPDSSFSGPSQTRGPQIIGWVIAANALALLFAVAGGAPVAGAAQQFAGWCGIG